MYCMKCNHDLFECTCPDLAERLASLGNSPHLIMTHCSGCGEHVSRCRCPDKPETELRSQGRIVVDPRKPADANETTVRIENWKRCFDDGRSPNLEGDVYGHPRFPDGTHIYTSTIEWIDEEKRKCKTRNRIYSLGETGASL